MEGGNSRGVNSGREMKNGRRELTSRSGYWEFELEETFGNGWMEQRRQILSKIAAELCS